VIFQFLLPEFFSLFLSQLLIGGHVDVVVVEGPAKALGAVV
jgi:hypothetical protein